MKKTKLIKTFGLISLVGMSTFGCTTINPNSSSSNDELSVSSSETTSYNEDEIIQGIYQNPCTVTRANSELKYSGEIADPSVVRGDDGYFYSFSTAYRVLRSEDACNWELYSENIIKWPSWGAEVSPYDNDYNLWAPDVVKVGDKWIYYYSLSGWDKPRGIGYAIADEIAGPYEDQGKLFSGDEMGIKNCIDPQTFVDDDGSVYMTVGSFQGLYMVELTDDGMGLKNGLEYQKANKTLIAGYDGNWDGATYEGSYIIKKDDYYYYFGSAGSCCVGKNSTYKVYVGRSKNIKGPYVDANNAKLTDSRVATTNGNLVLQKPMAMDGIVAGVGHNSILLDDFGDYWIYYHGYSKNDNFGTRHLFMDKLLWDEDGFPYVEGKRPSFDEEIDGPRFILDY